jgi:AcrR family transcriptional regulator
LSTLRDRNRQRARQDLIEAGARLFQAQGFDATTIAEIAAEAQVSRRTFFRYFPTKEDLALAFEAGALDGFIAHLEARPDLKNGHTAVLAALFELVSRWEQPENHAGLEELLASRRVSAASPSLHAAYLRMESLHDARVVALLSDRMQLDPESELRLRLWVGFINIASRTAVNILADAHDSGAPVHPVAVYRRVLGASGLLADAFPVTAEVRRDDPTFGGWLAAPEMRPSP